MTNPLPSQQSFRYRFQFGSQQPAVIDFVMPYTVQAAVILSNVLNLPADEITTWTFYQILGSSGLFPAITTLLAFALVDITTPAGSGFYFSTATSSQSVNNLQIPANQMLTACSSAGSFSLNNPSTTTNAEVLVVAAGY